MGRSATVVWCLASMWVGAVRADQTLYPVKDGTLADGGVYGAFDGTADDADWYFNESSYEGSISRSTSAPNVGLEHRVIWEYNLATVTQPAPVRAVLHFVLRGAPIFPMPDAVVHIYSYPADLQESLADFKATPAELQGKVTVAAYQAATAFEVDVSGPVRTALANGGRKVAFRFQINPATPNAVNQAYIDALDSDQSTKPRLVIGPAPAVAGDTDGDGDVDAADFLGFPACMTGPVALADAPCAVYDFNADGHVDLADFELFQGYASSPD